jgi:hypothetical protein
MTSIRLISSIFVDPLDREVERPEAAKTARVAAGGTYGGGQLSLVSEVSVVTSWQALSMQYSVTPSWKMVQSRKFYPDGTPGAPVEVTL